MSIGRKNKNKWVKVSSIIALVLVVVAVAGYLKTKTAKKENDSTYFQKDITRFCINNYCLEKKDIWKIIVDSKEIPASEEMATSYASKFSGIKMNDLISENKDKFADLGFGEQKTILEVSGKKMEIGKITSTYDGTYIKEVDGGKVYKIGEIVDVNLIKDINFWEVKNVTNLPIYQIKKINVTYGVIKKEAAPVDGKWKNDSLINKLAMITTTKYLENFKPSDDIAYEFDIEIDGQENKKIYLGKYWVSTDKKYYFEISKADFQTLTSDIK